MMRRRGLRWIGLVGMGVAAVGIGLGGFRSASRGAAPPPSRGVVVASWQMSLGAVGPSDTALNEQRLAFAVTLWNAQDRPEFVSTVRLRLADALGRHVVSGSPWLTVDRTLAPHAAIQVHGQLLLDTRGMTKAQVLGLGGIQGVTVRSRP
jgi:hypothetical protein